MRACSHEASMEDVWGRASLCIWRSWCRACVWKWKRKVEWRNGWIHLGMEKIGMKVFELPFLSVPPCSFLWQCHLGAALPSQTLVLNPLKAPLLLLQLEINKRVGAEDRLSPWEESWGAPRFLLEMCFVTSKEITRQSTSHSQQLYHRNPYLQMK